MKSDHFRCALAGIIEEFSLQVSRAGSENRTVGPIDQPLLMRCVCEYDDKGWRARCFVGGRAMSTVFYILIGLIAFGACYAVYGIGVAIARLIRCRFVASEHCRAQQRRRAF